MSYLNRKKGQYKPQLKYIDYDFEDGEGVQKIPLIPITVATRQRLVTSRFEKMGVGENGVPIVSIDLLGKAKDLNYELIAATVADADGKPVYTLEDLREWTADEAERFSTAISKVCPLFAKAEGESTETPENPPSGPTSSSGT